MRLRCSNIFRPSVSPNRTCKVRIETHEQRRGCRRCSTPVVRDKPCSSCWFVHSSPNRNLDQTRTYLFKEAKHRGFAFITFTQALDAQDAIDNMDMNEFRGRVLKVNLAKPQKGPVQGAGNRASSSCKQSPFPAVTDTLLQSGSPKNGSKATPNTPLTAVEGAQHLPRKMRNPTMPWMNRCIMYQLSPSKCSPTFKIHGPK